MINCLYLIDCMISSTVFSRKRGSWVGESNCTSKFFSTCNHESRWRLWKERTISSTPESVYWDMGSSCDWPQWVEKHSCREVNVAGNSNFCLVWSSIYLSSVSIFLQIDKFWNLMPCWFHDKVLGGTYDLNLVQCLQFFLFYHFTLNDSCKELYLSRW